MESGFDTRRSDIKVNSAKKNFSRSAYQSSAMHGATILGGTNFQQISFPKSHEYFPLSKLFTKSNFYFFFFSTSMNLSELIATTFLRAWRRILIRSYISNNFENQIFNWKEMTRRKLHILPLETTSIPAKKKERRKQSLEGRSKRNSIDTFLKILEGGVLCSLSVDE